jgi:hypothetical protein
LIFAHGSLLSAEGPLHRHRPLATLGDSLALCRLSTSASGFSGAKFDVGAYQIDAIFLIEVDAEGRHRPVGRFPADRLGDAIVRLYERYAELLPDGPERDRAGAVARSVATLFGPLDLDCYRAALARDLAFVGHRSVGVGSLHGAEALLTALGALLALAPDAANRIDDVLGVRSDALLARWTNFGTDCAGGGTFERPFIMLRVFGRDGLATRGEQVDADREAEALARFDVLTLATREGEPLAGRSGSEGASPSLAAVPSRGEKSIGFIVRTTTRGIRTFTS